MQNRERLRTGDQALVRQINTALVLDVLRTRAPISRASLSQITGLNKSTISDLIADLHARRFVRELGQHSAGLGRPGTLLELNPGAGMLIAAEIAVEHIEVALADFAPAILWQQRSPLAPGDDHTRIIALLLELLRVAAARGEAQGMPLLGIAVGVPGIVEQGLGRVALAPNLGWRDIPLRDLLERERFGAPVFVDNEANLAALGEHYFGAAQGCAEVLYLSVGAGLGGGIIRDGRLYRGVSGGAAEFGHMTLDGAGELCRCGNRGCWETLVSQPALLRSIARLLAQGRPSTLANHPGEPSVALVAEAARAGDPVASEALDTLGRWLGTGIATLLNALNPELVVVGGALSPAADLLLPAVEAELGWRALPRNRDAARVVPAAHHADACLRGGLALVYQAVLEA
ncbi:MAG TPA: ROK family protein [Roseiflexaceae bacterium]|nr:ROK family protein [Roseiflexaceae bacterium]